MTDVLCTQLLMWFFIYTILYRIYVSFDDWRFIALTNIQCVFPKQFTILSILICSNVNHIIQYKIDEHLITMHSRVSFHSVFKLNLIGYVLTYNSLYTHTHAHCIYLAFKLPVFLSNASKVTSPVFCCVPCTITSATITAIPSTHNHNAMEQRHTSLDAQRYYAFDRLRFLLDGMSIYFDCQHRCMLVRVQARWISHAIH